MLTLGKTQLHFFFQTVQKMFEILKFSQKSEQKKIHHNYFNQRGARPSPLPPTPSPSPPRPLYRRLRRGLRP